MAQTQLSHKKACHKHTRKKMAQEKTNNAGMPGSESFGVCQNEPERLCLESTASRLSLKECCKFHGLNMFGKTVHEIKGTKPKGKRKQEISDLEWLFCRRYTQCPEHSIVSPCWHHRCLTSTAIFPVQCSIFLAYLDSANRIIGATHQSWQAECLWTLLRYPRRQNLPRWEFWPQFWISNRTWL